jgi:hypothetical protein
VLAIQRETQDFKTFDKAANPDQDLNMTRYALFVQIVFINKLTN